MGLLSHFQRRRNSLSLDWIQIEVSSLCNASCFYCPHTIYRDCWRHGSMDLETFKNIATAFKMAKLIFLQGWGEPFLNDRLFEMIEIAKKSGSKVGLTTNGMALDAKTINHLIDLKLDILGISLAGTKSETHNRLREGTDFERITGSLLEMREKKERKNESLPRVHLAYILLKSNFEDLRQIIEYAKKVGSRNVVCSNLTFISCPELRKEAIFLDEFKRSYYVEILKGLETRAKKNDVNFFYPPFPEKPMPLCPENILKSCYISHDGSLSSCVFTNIPVSEKEEPDSMGEKKGNFQKSIIYGNINQQTLSEIWNSQPYQKFRDIFNKRQKSITEDMDLIIDMIRFQTSGIDKVEESADHLSALPWHCESCYRIYGF